MVELQQADLLAQAKQIIDLNKGMIEALAAAIEFRSEESGDHVRRIHDITLYMLTHTALGEGLSKSKWNRSPWGPSCTTWARLRCPTPS